MILKAHTLKTALGIMLVILAIAALLFWEAEGRKMLLMDDVYAADKDIKIGEIIDLSLFHIMSAPAGTLVDGAITPKNVNMISGKEAAVDIIKGAQLSSKYLRDPDAIPKPETSYFIIRNEWISMCTSSLRRGDDVLIASADGRSIIGRFPVAYVKDSDGREVVDASSGMYSFTGSGGDSGRINTSATIHHIEIECELKDYRRIIDYCVGSPFAPLMLVREMPKQ